MPQKLPLFTQRLNTEMPTHQQREQITKQIAQQKQTGDYLSLDYDTRQRSRFKASTQAGRQVGIDLPRTDTLKDGCILTDTQGNLLEVCAAKQTLTQVTAPDDDFFALMKAAYHLGNRHVPLMLTPTALYFEPDHVLSDMLQRLDVQTKTVEAAFEPETGAYQQHGGHSHHNHDHSHGHSHNHSHNHSHSHEHHSHAHHNSGEHFHAHSLSPSSNHHHSDTDNHSHVHCDK